jgi:TetR/AcrR family transcriptional regulator, transcriptional repressor for nem operon
MKKSKAETAETRRRIIEIASQQFKAKGITATGVAEIMAAAGLTHGGFYRHFDSKEQLIAEACANSMDQMVDSVVDAAEGGRDSLLTHLEHFLSTERRDNVLSGCPLVAMGSEIVRADGDARRAATKGFESVIGVIAESSELDDETVARDDALFIMSSVIGAIMMARIVDDPALSDRILEIAKDRLPQNVNKPARKTTKKRAA